jgi:DNA-binding CsgD family transcriptional regulator
VRDLSFTAQELVGRDDELGAILGFLDARDHLRSALVLPGEAGIGKTTLWLAGIDAAAARGYRILSSRPSGAETRFSFSGLTDLLGNAAGDVVSELPPVQRRALQSALLLGDSELDADDRAVAAAFLAAVRLLARDGPLCIAVDDVQWLTQRRFRSFATALARLDDEPVAALLAVRGEVPEWLRRLLPRDSLRTVEVAGLSLGATHRMLHARLGATFARPTLIRLWETSRGNPFFTLELASALQRNGGSLAPGEELPIPSSLEELLHARIDSLGPAALEVARVVAALADPTVKLVDAAVVAWFDAGLDEALDARIVELDGERLRFTHPVLGSAVAARQTPARRRSLHTRLAEIVVSAEERARHLALATAEPDLGVAAILEEAARAAQARGAPAAAADLAEQALRLTPVSGSDDARRRLFLAADLHHGAGDTERANALLEDARTEAAPGIERATVLAYLARAQVSPQRAIPLYHEALLEAQGDNALQATIHFGLAMWMRLGGDGFRRALEHAELAVSLASDIVDAELRCQVLGEYGRTHFAAGRGIAWETMEGALSAERSLDGWPLHDGPTFRFGEQLLWSVHLDRARALFQDARDAGLARNDPVVESDALWGLGFVEWRAGNWEKAERYTADSIDLQKQLGRLLPHDELPAAIIWAHQGRVEDARARAQAAIARADAEDMRIPQSGHGWVLGFVELQLGDARVALAFLRQSYELRDTDALDPGERLELGDLLEALISVGELDEAEEVLTTWHERAASLDRAWALAILARCRGLLLAARGDLDGAFASFECSLAEHARSSDPFQHARTLLALGRTQRRAKKRGEARATLDDALARFERLGAPLWAEQTRAELARIGGRASSHGLTEAESRIAMLVAEGRTNREVAAALFLTVHSVETTLTRVYRKLEVRSRAELAHLFAANS